MTKKFSMAALVTDLAEAHGVSITNAEAIRQNGRSVQHALSDHFNQGVEMVGQLAVSLAHAGAAVANSNGAPEAAPRPTRRRPLPSVRNANAQPSARQQQREARAYAESWHQALKDWQRRSGGLLVIHDPGRSGTGRQMVPVVGNWNSAPSGVLRYPEVHTPMGWVAESALAVRCNAEPYLSRLRNGQGLVSLVHANGRGWNRAEAKAYAAVVLAMAADLGDVEATHHFKLLIVADSGTISLELDNL